MSKPLKGYIEAIDWLFEQFPSYQIIGSKAYKPTLDNIAVLLDLIGNPQDELIFVHVAGSNGKGSTCSIIASALTESGHKVGLFTSPHLEDYTERIRINGICISQEAVLDFVKTIRKQPLTFSPSFFEISFALALDYFKSQKCAICIIETGLGGRLDATNVIKPVVSVITTISLEHTDILGDTLEEIAREKAGIIKNTVPVIIGDMNETVSDVLLKIARSRNAKVSFIDAAHKIPAGFPLVGNYQKTNYQLARTVLDYLNSIGFETEDEAIASGLKNIFRNTGFRGRLQVISSEPLTILDVSHNFDGVRETLATVSKMNRGTLHIIYGSSAEKDIKGIISILPDDAKFYYTEFTNSRTATMDQLREASKTNHPPEGIFDNALKAYEAAQNSAKQLDTILIIGSFFLVTDFF
ncbi:MAG: dihydrofolate synthase/folylpolyglutamate synthase [Crocinitomicaceae bacterium]|jgi:dihydrofolate synthase/folylpolyglutamate synthase